MQGKLRHQVTLGNDPRGNLVRLDNALAQMPQRLKAFQTQLEETFHQRDAAKTELAKPFPYEDELRDKTARLIFLDAELNLDAHKSGQPEQVVKKESPQVPLAQRIAAVKAAQSKAPAAPVPTKELELEL